MSDLPNWVYDVVMALDKHAEEHPRYYVETLTPAPDRPGVYAFAIAESCGCESLTPVPAEVRAQARAMRTYLDRAKPEAAEPVCTCPVVDISTLKDKPGERVAARGLDPACPIHGGGA